MDDHPESESDVADEVENMEQQTESPSPGPSPSKVLLSGPEQVIWQHCKGISLK